MSEAPMTERDTDTHELTSNSHEIPPPPPSMREAHETDFPAQFEEALDRLEGVIEENDRTVKTAISSLRTLVLKHYHRTTKRLDDHAKRLRVLEKHCGVIREEPPASDRRAPDSDQQ